MLDASLARSISEWVQRAPRHVLQQLADSASARDAADELGELIVSEMTMAYPEHIESIQPPLPFER